MIETMLKNAFYILNDNERGKEAGKKEKELKKPT